MFISYAQNGEDVWLQRVFENKHDGFYIDVGAHMPVIDSVTKAFYDRGWCGINIEPIPHLHAQFVAERKRDINLQVGVGDRIETLELYIPHEGYEPCATFDAQVVDIVKERTGLGSTLLVDVTTLNAICQQYSVGHIDFLKIDVEGFENKVISGMDFVKFRPIIIVVESTIPMQLIRDPVLDAASATWHDWEPILLGAGYLFATFDGLNRYYVRQEDQSLVSKFIIPISPMVDRFVRHDSICQVPTVTSAEPVPAPEPIIRFWDGTPYDSDKIKMLSRAMANLYLS